MYCVYCIRWSLFVIFIILFLNSGAGEQNVTVNAIGCRFDSHSTKWNIYLNLYFHFFTLVSMQNAALSSVTQHAMPTGLRLNWVTECLNARFPLPTLLCAGYNMKLIWFNFFLWLHCDLIALFDIDPLPLVGWKRCLLQIM